MIDSLIHNLKRQLKSFATNNSCDQYVTLEVSLAHHISLKPINKNNSFFLAKPESGFTLLGLDTCVTIEAIGSDRFNIIKKQFNNLLNNWKSVHTSSSFSPIAFFSCAFDDNDPMNGSWKSLANTQLTIPLLLIKQEQSTQILQVNLKLDSTDFNTILIKVEEFLKEIIQPVKRESVQTIKANHFSNDSLSSAESHEAWHTLATAGIHEIQSNHFDKLVTTRHLKLKSSATISQQLLISKLIKHYPCCTIYSHRLADKTIVAASPERLVSLQNSNIQSDALGGTIHQPEQASPSDKNLPSLPFFLKQQNNQTEDEVFESKKLLKEHNYISRSIYQNLDPLCHTLKMPVSPYLIKLHNLYHLETPIQGKLMAMYDLFDAIKMLHPTPAVAGLPTQKAKQWLLKNENYSRGWYTGAFGWLEGPKKGDMSVMLRCALIKSSPEENGTEVELFSGAGLVSESTPEAEWQETELKMKTILDML